MSVTAIVVESGVVYSFCLILLIILYMKQQWSETIVEDSMPQIIVSNLIHVNILVDDFVHLRELYSRWL